VRPVRPAACAGSVYPAEPAALRAALDRWLSERGAPPPPARAAGDGAGPARTRLLVAPHIDYPRGARGYARAYAALSTDADVFVVFGTAHSTPPRLYTLTRRDHATPLGTVPTDLAVVDAVAAEVGPEEVLRDERAHDDEHSIELQLVVLRHRVRRPFTAVPVLCSSLSHLAEPARFTSRFLSALGRALRGRRVCFVASADLAHLGPAYGDPRPPDGAEAARLEARDRETLAYLAAGDADGFHRDAVRDDDRRRLCGLAPIYAAMKASGTGARLLHYERWTDGVDSVSFAAAAG
jgi:AmmeMemoRadiSam system protein B